MAKARPNQPRFRILHGCVGSFYKGEVVTFDWEVDTDRLVELGAIEPVPADWTPPVLVNGDSSPARVATVTDGDDPRQTPPDPTIDGSEM